MFFYVVNIMPPPKQKRGDKSKFTGTCVLPASHKNGQNHRSTSATLAYNPLPLLSPTEILAFKIAIEKNIGLIKIRI